MEAAPGFEPGMEDLQSSALATWLCRPRGGIVMDSAKDGQVRAENPLSIQLDFLAIRRGSGCLEQYLL